MTNSIYDFLMLEAKKEYILDYKSDLLDYMKSEKFLKQLRYYLKGRSFSVFSLLELFYDLFVIYLDIPPMEWIVHIFNWANNKSFPHKGKDKYNKDLIPLYTFFLESLQYILSHEELVSNEFIKKYPLSFLTSVEELDKDMDKEYFVFKDVFNDVYINELMHLDMAITGHNTLDHVIGVNHLSMYIARQLHELKLPVDLGLVAGASLGHDIGKYGVVDKEIHRVPYLHYYYTEEWFNRFGMNRIGHIATNHSTWDLELETLPIESLILIYADFRVKNKVTNGNYNMHIYSLEESFNVILEKLDDVDIVKENRYKKVYKRLKDFEDYMVSMGVDTTLKGTLQKTHKKPYELMDKSQVVNSLKHISIEHNINLMSKLTDNVSFNSILETTRGETNWRRLRFSLQIFDEYSTYLTQSQKIKTLYLLYDLLHHTGEDIRKEAAELIGKLIALFDEEYRKELPNFVKENIQEISSCDLLDEFLNLLLFPDHKIADSQKEWLYNLKNTIRSLFINSSKDYFHRYFDVIAKYYDFYEELPTIAQFYLSQTIDYLPIEKLNQERLLRLFTYTLNQLESSNVEIRLTTLDSISHMLDKTKDVIFIASIRNWLITHLDNSTEPSENYIKYIIGRKINISADYFNILVKNYIEGDSSEIFLQNLKTATPWVNKKINIDILYDQVIESPKVKGLHTSMHLCNLLKVSAVERVRNYGGTTLLNIFHLLSLEERNDVAIELLRALEMESYQFTKFIPDYLGQLLLFLPPKELDEIIDDFEDKIKVSSTRVTFLLLNTIAVSVEKYMSYRKRFSETPKVSDERINRLLGLLAIGMASYNHDIKSESLRLISLILFKSNSLSLKEKYYIFSKIEKKILTLLDLENQDEFLFYNNVSSLNNIYKFISDYEFYYDDFKTHRETKIAFFPGTFDPFSLSHKEIAVEIRDMGFEVYLAVDEFSWSKRTEPHNFRRNIINMSIANEKDINLFPKNIPINIGNAKDLNYLNTLFPGGKVYMVVGSDVIINASAYKGNGAILDYPHIIFDRKSSITEECDETMLETNIKNIKSHIIRLTLPPRYEDISSSQIRENIDLNRDISKYIDPLAESYIYNYDLYLRAPQYKTLLQSKTLETDIIRSLDTNASDEIYKTFGSRIDYDHMQSIKEKLNYRILLLRDSETNILLGFSTFYWIRQNMLFEEFRDTDITDFIRKNAKGRTVLISGLCALNDDPRLIEIILNETLSLSINRDYNFSLYNNMLTNDENTAVEEQLSLQGFVKTTYVHDENPLFIVDMNSPMTLNLDIENLLKPPFDTDKVIVSSIRNTRKKLKSALVNLYPGQLLLTFNRDMIYSKLIQKICDANEVDIVQGENRKLGPSMCVPFGSILNGSILPNTVTKAMHTEKTFEANIVDFTIESSPYYLSLMEQANILKSFNRSLILVDDLLHKGYRINVIEPILRMFDIKIKKVIVGILSGRGKEIGSIKNLDLDYAYFVPNLKLWFNESSQYPFIGGDMVGKSLVGSNLIPSINMILPYVSPRFIKDTENQAIYNLSEVCLQNTYEIFKSLEEVYQSINEKNLNIKNLREVITLPRYPDIHKNIYSNRNTKPSSYIEMDIELLKRMENIINR